MEPLTDDAVTGLDEDGPVRQQANLEFRGSVLVTRGRRPRNALHDVERGSVAALSTDTRARDYHPAARCWSAAQSVAHIRYITKIDRGIANHLDGQVISSGTVPCAWRSAERRTRRNPSLLCRTGRIRFCCWTAVRMSCGASPFDCTKPGFKSIMTWPLLPAIEERKLRPRHRHQLGFSGNSVRGHSNCCSESPLPERPSCRMGTLEAL